MTPIALRVHAGRRFVLATALAAGVTASLAGSGAQLPAAAARSTVAPARSATAGVLLGAGQVGARATVPWRKVGPGWALADYSATSAGLSGPRALFTTIPTQQVHQLDLRTGQITSFALPLNVLATGCTRPGGAGILALGSVRGSDTNSRLIRYDLRGHLRKALWTGFTDGVRSAPGGRTVAVGVSSGLDRVAAAGGLIRRLPVPGVAASCVPIRWWSAAAVLASCTASEVPGLDAQRLWLVAVSGSRPKALTPQRPDHGPDQGDFNAWQLPAGQYLQAQGPVCGGHVIVKQRTGQCGPSRSPVRGARRPWPPPRPGCWYSGVPAAGSAARWPGSTR